MYGLYAACVCKHFKNVNEMVVNVFSMDLQPSKLLNVLLEVSSSKKVYLPEENWAWNVIEMNQTNCVVGAFNLCNWVECRYVSKRTIAYTTFSIKLQTKQSFYQATCPFHLRLISAHKLFRICDSGKELFTSSTINQSTSHCFAWSMQLQEGRDEPFHQKAKIKQHSWKRKKLINPHDFSDELFDRRW